MLSAVWVDVSPSVVELPHRALLPHNALLPHRALVLLGADCEVNAFAPHTVELPHNALLPQTAEAGLTR